MGLHFHATLGCIYSLFPRTNNFYVFLNVLFSSNIFLIKHFLFLIFPVEFLCFLSYVLQHNLLPSQATAARLFQGFIEASVRPKYCTSRFNGRFFTHWMTLYHLTSYVFRLWTINCKRRSVVVFYHTNAGNAGISLGNLENSYSGWSVFRHTRAHVYHMRIRMASHSSSLFVITHPSEWHQVLLYRHILHHSLTPWSSLLRRYSIESRNSVHFMVYKDTLPCKLQPENGPYSKPHQSSLQPPMLFL